MVAVTSPPSEPSCFSASSDAPTWDSMPAAAAPASRDAPKPRLAVAPSPSVAVACCVSARAWYEGTVQRLFCLTLDVTAQIHAHQEDDAIASEMLPGQRHTTRSTNRTMFCKDRVSRQACESCSHLSQTPGLCVPVEHDPSQGAARRHGRLTPPASWRRRYGRHPPRPQVSARGWCPAIGATGLRAQLVCLRTKCLKNLARI